MMTTSVSPTLRHLLKPIDHWLTDPEVEEICINEPGSAFIYARGGFVEHPVALDASSTEDIAVVAGAQNKQDVGPDRPLLSADLPGGGRLQAVLPPCVAAGKPSLTIRKPSTFSPTLEMLAGGGLFSRTKAAGAGSGEGEARLNELRSAGRWQELLELGVRLRKTIVLCGATASGKTTLAKALIHAIPRDERLITIEDTPEWTELPHRNRVALFYSKGSQSQARVSATDLVEASLRMRIGRLLLQELRDGKAAMSFLRALASGHPGGITTVHAINAVGAFEAIGLMIRDAKSTMSDADTRKFLTQNIDIVAHCQRDATGFGISEVWLRSDERMPA